MAMSPMACTFAQSCRIAEAMGVMNVTACDSWESTRNTMICTTRCDKQILCPVQRGAQAQKHCSSLFWVHDVFNQCTGIVQSIDTKLTVKMGGTAQHVSLELHACITLQPVTKIQPYLLYTEGLGPTGSPVIADSSLPDALALLLMSATSASNAHQ